MTDATERVLYLVCCGSPLAAHAPDMVALARARGWTVCVLTTAYGRRFVDVERLEELTGYPVRSDYKQPGEPDVLPPPTALAVAPATVNTVNKWAAGLCDGVALGYLVEAYGLGLPIVAAPYSNRAHMAHPAFQESLERLRSWGVTVLTADDLGPARPQDFPWQRLLDALS
ncbi:flavoprotein [Actinomadura parmotrematis]|uniref:Flavoprotein n=1 Tax=Actinomadura parmotrematis TaxID=2864039 RepID=A0ABS7G479_9ACTN|nr:flavoprotein [Actinomadura parmotrematis]MBW8487519.1 flavoprotein [Actinomadura parmotrematis]